jgi:hypothetical protein
MLFKFLTAVMEMGASGNVYAFLRKGTTIRNILAWKYLTFPNTPVTKFGKDTGSLRTSPETGYAPHQLDEDMVSKHNFILTRQAQALIETKKFKLFYELLTYYSGFDKNLERFSPEREWEN